MVSRNRVGHHQCLGVQLSSQGANFCLYARLAKKVELLLFDGVDDAKPSRIIRLDAQRNRTAYYWHIWVPGIEAGQLYGYRVDGPYRPYSGSRFDGQKLLLDPYAGLLAKPKGYSRKACSEPGANLGQAYKSVVVDHSQYDWQNDSHPRHPFNKTILYELHVAGFTKHPSSGLGSPLAGSYAGLIAMIPHLRYLGITAVELMPVFQFDPSEHPAGLVNYWGYSPVSFFAPHREYSSDSSLLGPAKEFKDMVKALHKAGIEVILDVVYNHSSEGGDGGPYHCLRGLDNDTYYMMSTDKQHYLNYSGCGNTLNASHSVVRRMILDSLHAWVRDYHVDGFRFDLAAILSRGEDGQPLVNPPTLFSIDTDPLLASTKIIAEAWDAGGLYQVGQLAGQRWREWNGPFRDDMRSYLKGDDGCIGKLVTRFLGSPDLYSHQAVEPEKSINFITSHDGFCLHDLLAYNQKHNFANGEHNRDGDNHNLSWNHGFEGPTADAEILTLRHRQAKNALALITLAFGSPMLLMGDEMGRSQQGNNNAYCQDNEISWLDWGLVARHQGLIEYCRGLIALRHQLPPGDDHMPPSLQQVLDQSHLRYHGLQPDKPDWSPQSRVIALTGVDVHGRFEYYLLFNTHWQSKCFELAPSMSGLPWRLVLNTGLPDQQAVIAPGRIAGIYEQAHLTLLGRSLALLRT